MDWQYYFSTTSGVSITESNGVYLEKGQTRVIELNYQPKASENVGFYPVTFSASSKTHQSVISELSLQLEVVPDRIPECPPYHCPPKPKLKLQLPSSEERLELETGILSEM